MINESLGNTDHLKLPKILAKLDSGSTIDELSREYRVSVAALHKWQNERAKEADEASPELKQLQEDNARLEKMIADLSLDHEILKEGYELLQKFAAQDAADAQKDFPEARENRRRGGWFYRLFRK